MELKQLILLDSDKNERAHILIVDEVKGIDTKVNVVVEQHDNNEDKIISTFNNINFRDSIIMLSGKDIKTNPKLNKYNYQKILSYLKDKNLPITFDSIGTIGVYDKEYKIFSWITNNFDNYLDKIESLVNREYLL